MSFDVEKYKDMSPFEVKNELIEAAKKSAEKRKHKGKDEKILNAGRGNPNFLNTTVRNAFSLLCHFSTEEANTLAQIKDLGCRPLKKGLYEKLVHYVEIQDQSNDEVALLKNSIDYAINKYKFDKDEFVYEMVDAALGDYYPMPSRIFPCMEKIVIDYLAKVLTTDNKLPKGHYDLFATEGATAAMIYIFNSLKVNHIVEPGDSIGILTPIFSPYLEIPVLHDFQLMEILVEGKEELKWQIPDSEIEKLKNPKIKAIYLVNPANPTAVALDENTIKKITHLVKNDRKDLIVLTDTVYATFVDKFHSLLQEIPENVLCVYSYSKYFGVTGWRLGVIMLHEDNVIDKMIQALPEKAHAEIHERYKTICPDPKSLKFIDRLEIDSREPALAHTGGLSCPQQALMCLFSIFELLDTQNRYKDSIHYLLRKRIKNLYNSMEEPVPEEKGNTYYYTLIDLIHVSHKKYGPAFAKHLLEERESLEYLFRLADEKLTICLPGEGFAGPKWSIRISLANLNLDDYKAIGKNIRELLHEYYEEWSKKRK